MISEESQRVYKAAFERARRDLLEVLNRKADLECEITKIRNGLIALSLQSGLSEADREEIRIVLANSGADRPRSRGSQARRAR